MGDPLKQFIESLAPARFDRAVASRRRESIERLLSTASIRSDYLFESGSWSHGTAIAAKSDVDYMARIDSERPSLPSSALARLRQVIDDSHGLDVYKVRTSSPVVSVEFYTDPHFEIVPAYYERSVGETIVYWIPGRGDEWVLSAPDAHLAYVNRQNDRLGKKVKSLVRLMKAWKYFVDAPVSSFYLETRTRSTPPGSPPSSSRSTCLAVFRTIVDFGARDMNDPEGLVGRIPACASKEKRNRTLSLMRDAMNTLDRADEARRRGNASDYWSNMYDVFGSQFPYPVGW